MEKRSPLFILLGTCIFIALFASVILFKPVAPIEINSELQAVLWPAPRQLNDFNLADKDLKLFDLERLAGKWTLLFFGYTHCPDVCPTTLTVLKAVYDGLSQHSKIYSNTQIVFVSVDPARDHPEQLGSYVSFFDENFIAATGSVEEIDNLTRQLSAGYILQEPNKHGSYQVDHTSSIYLIGPEQKAYGAFSPPHRPETILAQYLKVMNYQSRN